LVKFNIFWFPRTLARGNEKYLFILIFFLLIASVNSFAETLTVFSDRNPVALDESFHLIFKSTDSSLDSPDFSPLEKDFEILSQNQSTQIQIINGQQSSIKQWTLTVMAKRSGYLMIPAIYFGKEQTQPITISVNEAEKTTEITQTQRRLFLEVEATPKTPYVQSQVIYTIRLFYALDMQSASMSEPSFSGGEVLVKKLGEDRQYQTRRNGKLFSVIERKYALFPQQSGAITIEAINFKAQVIENRVPSSVFDNFFRQPSTHIKRLYSKAIKLNVKPIPSSFKGKNWLPAKNLTLIDSFSEHLPEFKVGEPVTRTLTLSAEGVTIGQLPEFMKFRKSIDKLKQYTDQPKLDEQITYQGLNSIREEKIAIIPSKAGEYTLPVIEIPWWNTETNEMAIVKLPARIIKVAATTIQEQSLPPQTTVPAQVQYYTQHIDSKKYNQYYELLTFIFAFGWIATLIAWWWTMKGNRIKVNSQKTPNQTEADKKTALKKLKEACKTNNAAEAKKALLAWGKISEIEPALQTEIEKLNKFLYGNTRENWQGIDLWKAFKTQKPEKVIKKEGDGLEPLYLKI
jgi:hypothetical protein